MIYNIFFENCIVTSNGIGGAIYSFKIILFDINNSTFLNSKNIDKNTEKYEISTIYLYNSSYLINIHNINLKNTLDNNDK